MASEFSGMQRESRFTQLAVEEIAVSVTGPHTANELGGPVIPGTCHLAGCREERG